MVFPGVFKISDNPEIPILEHYLQSIGKII